MNAYKKLYLSTNVDSMVKKKEKKERKFFHFLQFKYENLAN